jgi:TetR/AcrR family fatty acid metabolism transcriptional regulator
MSTFFGSRTGIPANIPEMRMQHIDEQKRIRIIEIAGRLFTERPFHEVRLEDVAAEANIGKGTIYVYFKSKADLCISLFIEGMERTIAEVRARLDENGLSPQQKIDRILHALLLFSELHPNFHSMVRELSLTPDQRRPLREKRQELIGVIEDAIRQEISQSHINDPHPELTARFLLACVREITFHTTPQVDRDVFINHIRYILTYGIITRGI